MTGFDHKRLLEHEVELGGLDHDAVSSVVREFLLYCDRTAAAHGDIPLASDEEAKTLREDKRLLMLMLGRQRVPEAALTQLLRRPRILKHALRRTWIAWQTLHGETDVGDLLVLSTIRTVSSSAFEFVREHWEQLTRTDSNERWDGNAAWKLAATTSEETELLATLMGFLFPSLGVGQRLYKVQGATSSRHWQRLITGWLDPSEIRDQTVAKELCAWRQTSSHALVDALAREDGGYAAVFEGLVERGRSPLLALEPGLLLRLTSEVLEVTKTRNGRGANFDSAAGLGSLWRLTRLRQGDAAAHERWLCDEIEKALPANLWLGYDLEYFWGGDRFLTEPQTHHVRKRVTDWARAHADAAYFCRVLTPSRPHLLLHFIGGPSRDNGLSEPDWANWDWVFPKLLEAMEQCPALVVPEFLSLITESARHLADRITPNDRSAFVYSWSLKPDRLKRVFPSEHQQAAFAAHVLALVPEQLPWSDDVKAMVAQIQSAFRAAR